MFKVSDKVVCVDDSGFDGEEEFYHSFPVKGVVYVIREVYFTHKKGTPVTGVCLVGVYGRPCRRTGLEAGFHAYRFRKLDEIKEENRLKNHEPQRTPEKVS